MAYIVIRVQYVIYNRSQASSPTVQKRKIVRGPGLDRFGNSLCVPAELKNTPLKVSLDTGFHSLVELLVRNEESQDVKNRALAQAVSLKRLDLIELLVSHGSEVSSVPFIEALYVWDPNIIRYFLDQGVDFMTDSPFAVAFREKIRTALRPWRECREKFPDLAGPLQEQADRALRYFCLIRGLEVGESAHLGGCRSSFKWTYVG